LLFTPTLLAALAVAAPVQAPAYGQVALEPQRDNPIWEDATGSLSSGAGDFVVAGRNGQGLARRALLSFDVAGALPAGAQVVSAALTLTVRQTSSGPRTIGLHRALADWGEGSSVATGGSGAAATAGDATWLHTFYPSAFWAAPGGDFAAGASASTVVDQFGPYTWTSPGLAADVQAMLDAPGSNFGWLLLGDESGPQTTKLFGSRELAVVSERPLLVIDWVPAPASYCTAGTSSAGCQALLSSSGLPSASAAAGFVVDAVGLEGGRVGIVFFGTSGRQAKPWGPTSSFRCMLPPVRRTPPQTSGGSPGACDGTLLLDLNAFWSANPGANPGAGTLVQIQAWVEDGAPGALSDALEVCLAP
jgi:hypothetical protein